MSPLLLVSLYTGIPVTLSAGSIDTEAGLLAQKRSWRFVKFTSGAGTSGGTFIIFDGKNDATRLFGCPPSSNGPTFGVSAFVQLVL